MGKIICAIFCLILFSGCSVKEKIYCPKCHKAYSGDIEICSKDNAPLNGYQYWFWSRGRNLPKMNYPAETYLIKMDGKFVWHPYGLDLSDFEEN